MGHLDIGDKRFWDARDENVYFNVACEAQDSLPSQASKRTDGRMYISRPIEEAQAEKERLEGI